MTRIPTFAKVMLGASVWFFIMGQPIVAACCLALSHQRIWVIQ